jgi:YfiH family protein
MTPDRHLLPTPSDALAVDLPRLTSSLLAAIPGVVHGFTRRRPGLGTADGNVSYSGTRDADEAWRIRRLWCRAIGVDPERLVTTGQVHGTRVLPITVDDAGRGARPGSGRAGLADAMITNEPGVVLLSMHADCLPILLVDPVTPAVGVVHAGWRGTVGDVAGAAIAAMTEAFGTDPESVFAYLGPAIAADCYEVGSDVAAAWIGQAGPAHQGTGLTPRADRWTFDVTAANALLLQRAGLRPERIELSGICTRCRGDEWFSHRGQGPTTGRFGALIALNE